MKKKQNQLNDENYFRRQMRPKTNALLKKDPEVAVETHLIKLAALDKELFTFWEDYRNYLSKEREKVLEPIMDSIYEAKSPSEEFKNMSRIVGGTYGHDPLCTFGSIIVPGGRFNIGQISSSLSSFQALYLAENYETAFCEKYLYRHDENLTEPGITPTDLQFEEPGTNVHIKTDIYLENYLDLREEGKLAEFAEIVSKVEISDELKLRALKLKMGSLQTTKTEAKLRDSIFETNYKQWGVLIDQPSNSQWIGHYAKLAGIQAILYPSCRSTAGFNIAVFPENFVDTDAYVEIRGDVSFVDPLRKKVDSRNFDSYTRGIPAPQFTHQIRQ